MNFKLNVKNTLLIGLAFFGILMLWQVYNTYCPMILEAFLKEKFGDRSNFIVGVIMALDNVAAILIMPIMGQLSDKTHSKFGKRMPYIVIGMALTAIIFPFIAIMCKLNSLAGVVVFMMLFLIIMQAYRSPAVAFMPDVTPKPLRSKANGIINLTGYIGGVFVTVLGMLPFFKLDKNSSLTDIQDKVLWPFLICTAALIIVLIILILTIKENKLIEETKAEVERGELNSDTEVVIDENNTLSAADKKNLKLILVAIFFWFMAFNAFETFGSLFFKNIVGDSTMYSTMATVLSVVSILSFILFSSLSNKIGRKWTIMIGLISLVAALLMISLVTLFVGNFLDDSGEKVKFSWKIFFIAMSAIMGFGWALVNINSFPMVVEFSNKDNIGKFTGYYYSSSMIAQSVTPILVGLIMDFLELGQKMLFIYSSVMMICAAVVFFMIKEKLTIAQRKELNKNQKKKSALETLGEMDD